MLKPGTDAYRSALRMPIELTPAEIKHVAGGLNPQPLPPGEDKP